MKSPGSFCTIDGVPPGTAPFPPCPAKGGHGGFAFLAQRLFFHIFPLCLISIALSSGDGGIGMKGNPEERAIALGQFVVETGATVRSAAQKFGVSKSTVHMEVIN